MVGCGGNTAPPPAESKPTTVSKTIAMDTPPVTAVEPTDKEKEPYPTENKDQATEPTVTVTEPTTTAQSTEEPKPTSPTKPAEPSVAEKNEHIEETPRKLKNRKKKYM